MGQKRQKMSDDNQSTTNSNWPTNGNQETVNINKEETVCEVENGFLRTMVRNLNLGFTEPKKQKQTIDQNGVR